MLNIKNEIKKAYACGGFRERYAIKNGQPRIIKNGSYYLIKFTYNTLDDYQDANGATWCINKSAWIN